MHGLTHTWPTFGPLLSRRRGAAVQRCPSFLEPHVGHPKMEGDLINMAYLQVLDILGPKILLPMGCVKWGN